MWPSDFDPFGLLKKGLTGKRFATDVDVRQAVTFWLQTRDIDFFLRQYTSLGATLGQMLKFQWWLRVGGVYDMPPRYVLCIEVRIKIWASECLLPYFLDSFVHPVRYLQCFWRESNRKGLWPFNSLYLNPAIFTCVIPGGGVKRWSV